SLPSRLSSEAFERISIPSFLHGLPYVRASRNRRPNERAQSMPSDLNANTDQQERDDAQHSVSEGGRHSLCDGWCVGIKHKNHEAQKNNAHKKSQKCANPIGKLEAFGLST